MLQRFNRHFFVRSIEADSLLESFLVSAIVAILGIRFFLTLTNYPLLGGEVLHIAHMLWGGLLMLVALVLLFVFLSKSVTRAAAVIGGFGFGAFIDELGKFITQDNDYFFQPTIALIYIIFVLLYLSLRAFKKYRTLSQKEYLVNALAAVREAILNNLSDQEKKQAFELLEECKAADPTVKALKIILHQFDSVPLKRLSLIAKTKQLLGKFYRSLVKRKWFKNAVIAFFIIETVVVLFRSMALIESARPMMLAAIVGAFLVISLINVIQSGLPKKRIFILVSLFVIFAAWFWQSFFNLQLPELSFIEWADLFFSALPGILVVIGIFVIGRSRLSAYLMFKHAVLVSIFLTQFFAFYQDQFLALIGLFINIVIFFTLKYMISQEEQMEKNKSPKH